LATVWLLSTLVTAMVTAWVAPPPVVASVLSVLQMVSGILVGGYWAPDSLHLKKLRQISSPSTNNGSPCLLWSE
jgi:hypothetical protein